MLEHSLCQAVIKLRSLTEKLELLAQLTLSLMLLKQTFEGTKDF